MARPMPINETTLTANTDTSVNRVITRTTASAPSSATRPTRAGMEAATSEPKIRNASSTTTGIDISSARSRSSEVISLTSL